MPAHDSRMPIRVESAPRVVGVLNSDSAKGRANEWIVLQTRL